MKISIITVVYNKVKFIADCITSVVSQTYDDIEYIIIDSKSTDGTLREVERYRGKIAKVVSEKDSGHFYAMNKGVGLATGEVIAFLHSDDMYADNRVIERVASAFGEHSLDSLYGDLVYTASDNPNRIFRHWIGGKFNAKKMKYGWMPPHPAFFVKKKVYEEYGSFNTDFKIAADYEIMLRFLFKHKISSFYLPGTLVKMRLGGISNKSALNLIKKTMEDYKACRMYGMGIYTILMKNIRKAPQFIRALNTKTV